MEFCVVFSVGVLKFIQHSGDSTHPTLSPQPYFIDSNVSSVCGSKHVIAY